MTLRPVINLVNIKGYSLWLPSQQSWEVGYNFFFLIQNCIFFFLSACVERWRRRFNSLCLMWEVTSKLTLAEEKNLICLHSLLSLTKLLASHCCRNEPEVAQCKDCVIQCSYAWSSQRWRSCLCIHHLPKPQMWLKTSLYIFIFCYGYSLTV